LDTLAPLVESVRAAAAARPLCICGAGSKDFYGRPPAGEPLDVRGHAGIVAYEPTELVVTARCGTPLAELETTLAARGQMIAFEPPGFGAGATVGGMVAAGLSGPRRAHTGALRDYVLGARILDGRGEVLTFGGQVMKNVAGYDVSRLMAGSLGTLGIILEVSLKTLPLPASESTLRFEMPEDKAIAQLNRWAGQPLPVSASVWHAGELYLRLSGARAAVAAACAKLGGERIADDAARAYWQGIREQTASFFPGAAAGGDRGLPLWRLSLPSTTPAAALGILGSAPLIEWGGALRWLATGADAASVRAVAAKAGGHATLFRAGNDARRAGVFHPLPAGLLAIHRKLKAAFDPKGIFNPGRLYADF
jgi:glycolate oxidase FAD binding subunit